MDFFSVLTMLGGLALFLYGMDAMGKGLEKVSGGKLERILERLTSNPLKAVLLGALVTMVIQSSSATTVMVVGFVNSGIMNLYQAVGIIMGANIGTTATSWILSLAGIESSNFFIRLLKPSSFSPILAVVGIVFLMFSKKERKKDVGTILVGFAILMFGMETMSGAVKPLANVPEFTSILTMFSNPLLGMLAGAVLTAVIQSSSASVGILQALCMTGAVSFGTALPIIMGQNIGTCVTAILSSIGANKNAKRAALIHLYFNLIGTLLFMAVFYTVNAFAHFAFLDEAANAAGIAVVHSTFNIVATLVLLPFSRGLVKLSMLTVKDRAESGQETKGARPEDGFRLLDPIFLESPGFAVEQSRNAAIQMAELSQRAIGQAIDLVGNYDEKRAEEVYAMEDQADRYEDELGNYLVRVSNKPLSEHDSRLVSVLLHCIGDFERISDHSINIVMAAREMYDKQIAFSEQAGEELKVFFNAIKEIVNLMVETFRQEDMQASMAVEPLEEVIDILNDELKERHISRLRQGNCTIELGFILSDITTNLERVSDHCSNVAVSMRQIAVHKDGAHGYLGRMRESNNAQFRRKVKEYEAVYSLD